MVDDRGDPTSPWSGSITTASWSCVAWDGATRGLQRRPGTQSRQAREIVVKRLERSAKLDEEARRVSKARCMRELLQDLGSRLFEGPDDAEIDLALLDRYPKVLMQLAAITIPKLPTRVDVTVETESIDAIEFTNRVQRFMDMADVVVANRLGSGRSAIEVESVDVSTNGHG